jgi:phage baseplate assembly protein W
MTAEQEIDEIKQSIHRLFDAPVGSRWQHVFYSNMFVEVVDHQEWMHGQNIGVYKAVTEVEKDAYWHMNIVEFLRCYRRLS